jgi:hypothetical protein
MVLLIQNTNKFLTALQKSEENAIDKKSRRNQRSDCWMIIKRYHQEGLINTYIKNN